MKTENINLVSFESKIPKQRYITENMRSGIESLLIRMNAETTAEEQGDYFVYGITNKLKHINGAIFEDERRYSTKVSHKEQMKGFSILQFGKTRFDIDNESGEIIDYSKPFYKPWFYILKKAENTLNDFRTNFYNENIIQKLRIKLKKLTPEGTKKMKQFVLNVEKQRLEELTKRLEEEI